MPRILSRTSISGIKNAQQPCRKLEDTTGARFGGRHSAPELGMPIAMTAVAQLQERDFALFILRIVQCLALVPSGENLEGSFVVSPSCDKYTERPVAAASLVSALPHDSRATAPQTNNWLGWDQMTSMFVFGDSYSTTGFNASTGPQPNATDPLGNPPYPGYTASNGPNWVDFLTTTYNASLVETYNLAYGGATVDSALVKQYLPTVLSMKQQVQDEFLPIYGKKDKSGVKWKPATTLFTLFIGINDVGNSYQAKNASLNAIIFGEYAGLVLQLYEAGARNFLFLNVPPVNRSPLTKSQGQGNVALEAKDIAAFNLGVKEIATTAAQVLTDSAVWLFNTNALFTAVLDNPKSFPQTAGYKNTTDYCFAYENGTASMTQLNASCEVPVNQYFWLNSLHPTFPMHNLTAYEISQMLQYSIPL